MSRMTTVALLLGLAACGSKKKDEAPPPPPSGSGSGSSAVAPADAAVIDAKPASSSDLADRAEACWNAWSDNKPEALAACYTKESSTEMPGIDVVARGSEKIVEADDALRAGIPDLKGQRQLVLVNGHEVVTVALLTGTQSAPLTVAGRTIAPTHKPVGAWLGQLTYYANEGTVLREVRVLDLATIAGQLSPVADHPVRPVVSELPHPKEVVISKGNDQEKANFAAFDSLTAAFNKHDAAAYGALLADDLTWTDPARPADLDKPALLAHLGELWKGFSKLELGVATSWAAGDYVTAVETLQGTNDGDLPSMKVAKTGKKIVIPMLVVLKYEGGKVKSSWVFYQGMQLTKQLGLK